MDEKKESILAGSARSFCKSFCAILGSFLALALIIAFTLSFFSEKNNGLFQKNTVDFLPDLNDQTIMYHKEVPVVLQIDINGIIGMGATTSDAIRNQLIESREGFFANNRVKAILLNVNTRGGAVFDSDDIYRMLTDYKTKYNIPVYAFINGICASGGVYITAAADQIYATGTSIIGSVGVLSGPFFNVSKTLDKIGIETLTITKGLNKDALSPVRPWKENDADSFKEIANACYKRFVNIVVSSRPKISKEQLISVYGAKIFIAKKAEKIGFIDKSESSYKETLTNLLTAAEIDETKPYQVVKLTPKKKFIDAIFENSALFNGKVNHEIKLSSLHDNQNFENCAYLYNFPNELN